jgi:DNA-binding transcriptional regulator YiaG
MSMKQSLLTRFGHRVQTQAVDRVHSGSPERLLLQWFGRASPNTPKAAPILARRHVGLKKAHLALTKLVEQREVVIEVPVVEDLRLLADELREVGIAVTRHEPPARLDVKGIRENLGVSQEEFALHYGLDVDTLRNWEQGRSKPDTAGRTILWMIATHPEVVSASLNRPVES